MTLAHDITGDGPAVLLLHSTVCDRRMWDPQVPALVAAGYRVIRADLRGYGETPVPDRPYSDADDVAGLLDGIDEVAVVGASGGGAVAVEFAARHPRRVTALVLLASALAGHEPGPELREFGRREDELLEAGDIEAATALNVDLWVGPAASKSDLSRVREMQLNAFAVQLAATEEHPQIEYDYDVAAITAPTLLVSGAHDLPDFREIAERLAATLPDARHLHLDWAGHLPSVERPTEINALLADFLRAAWPPPPA